MAYVKRNIDESVLRAEWAKGTRLSDIAVMVGVQSDGTVSRAAKALGLPSRTSGPIPNKERDAKIRELHAEGLHNAEIARRIKIDQDTIAKALRRLGLERNQAPKKERAEKEKPSYNGRKRASEFERARADAEIIVHSCAHCPWTASGPMAETRKAFDAHECANVEVQRARRDAMHQARASRPAPAMRRAA